MVVSGKGVKDNRREPPVCVVEVIRSEWQEKKRDYTCFKDKFNHHGRSVGRSVGWSVDVVENILAYVSFHVVGSLSMK